MSEFFLSYDDIPPSYNTYQRSHWAKQAKMKQAWQRTFELLLMEVGVPTATFVYCEVEATLRFPQLRRRDEGNFKVPIEKALGDALVNGGWLPDDTHEHFHFRHVAFEPVRGPKRMRVALRFAIAEGIVAA